MVPTNISNRGLATTMHLCTANGLDAHSMDITWIYQQYGALIQAELLGSRRLKENGLESIVAGMAPLCYGDTHG